MPARRIVNNTITVGIFIGISFYDLSKRITLSLMTPLIPDFFFYVCINLYTIA